jgi:chemotaxis protein MotB
MTLNQPRQNRRIEITLVANQGHCNGPEKFVHYTENIWKPISMLPYSTLMLTLVILFIMFYAVSQSNSVEYESSLSELASTNPNDPRVKQMKQEIALAQNVRDFIKKNGLSDKIQIIMTPHSIKIKMESIALFDSGKADLKQDIVFFLDHLNGQLKPMSNMVIAEGHTDTVPIHTQQALRTGAVSARPSASSTSSSTRASPLSGSWPTAREFRPAFSNETETDRARGASKSRWSEESGETVFYSFHGMHALHAANVRPLPRSRSSGSNT